jgi:hypothetical protein
MSPQRRSKHRSTRPLKTRTTTKMQPDQIPKPVVSAPRAETKSQPAGGQTSKLILGFPRWQISLLCLLVLLIFLLYLKTVVRFLPTGDSGELMAAAWNFGVAHPPGYPTFTILSHIAGLFPIGTPAFRMDLLSAVLDAMATGILGLGILRYFQASSGPAQIKSRGLIPVIGAVIGAGMLAVSTAFWSYSLVSEVFALNNLLAAVVIVLMLEWVRRPDKRWLLWMSFLFTGLALTNQMTFILLVPGLIFLLIWGIMRWRKKVMNSRTPKSAKVVAANPGWKLREIGIGLGFFVIGLLPYVYLPVAASHDPVVNWGDPRTLANFWNVIARTNYGTFSFTADSAQGDRLQQLVFLGRYFFNSFTLTGILLALLGVVWFVRRRMAEGIGLGIALLLAGPFFAMFANPQLSDPLTSGVFERFYILPGVLLAIFVAAGGVYVMEGAAQILSRVEQTIWPRTALLAGVTIAIAIPLSIGLVRIAPLDMSHDRVAENYGRDLLATLEPNSVLLMRSDENDTSVVYLQTVLGFRTDVAALDVELLKLSSYVDQQSRLHPGLIIPFSFYDEGHSSSLVDLVNANVDQRPVYGAGSFKEDLTKSFDEVYAGLAYQIVKKGTGTDSYALLRSESDRFASLHFPEKTYPPTSWEALIARHYGFLAHNIAYAHQKQEAQPDAAFVEKMYRIAILDDPGDAAAYKNLGLLLWRNNGSPAEIISIFNKYLQMAPDDPEDDNIRSVIKTLENKQS